ncbi:MAG: AAA family ATPase [Syntrophobacterales bacterium]|nr:MAG: AAA family ATPase [Syntrophobacterales bacterium]
MPEFEFEIFKKDRQQRDWPEDGKMTPPPPWRDFTAVKSQNQQEYRGRTYCPTDEDVKAINTAIHLRRPLLLTGNPGCGKSSLAYAIAWQLKLGEVLYWPIDSQTTIKDGLYSYDAISRLRDANLHREAGGAISADHKSIGNYLTLGPLGTALAPRVGDDNRPRVLLIDELDKRDIDLPNDLLNVFEEGCYEIDELVRLKKLQREVELHTAYRKTKEKEEVIRITEGHVQCRVFPIVVITSNQERQFPPAFLRRCLRHHIEDADAEELKLIAEGHSLNDMDGRIDDFVRRRREGGLLSNDQLLNALFLLNRGEFADKDALVSLVLKDLKD